MLETALVADSSPLIGLARIRQLDLLPKLAQRILIPPAVWHEVTMAAEEAPGARAVSESRFLTIAEADPARVEALRILVDRGEAEAIALAQGIEGSLLLLDDSRARRVAARLGARHLGTVGLLRRAKKQGLIAAIKPHLEALVENGIYIRKELIDAVLADVGE